MFGKRIAKERQKDKSSNLSFCLISFCHPSAVLFRSHPSASSLLPSALEYFRLNLFIPNHQKNIKFCPQNPDLANRNTIEIIQVTTYHGSATNRYRPQVSHLTTHFVFRIKPKMSSSNSSRLAAASACVSDCALIDPNTCQPLSK